MPWTTVSSKPINQINRIESTHTTPRFAASYKRFRSPTRLATTPTPRQRDLIQGHPSRVRWARTSSKISNASRNGPSLSTPSSPESISAAPPSAMPSLKRAAPEAPSWGKGDEPSRKDLSIVLQAWIASMYTCTPGGRLAVRSSWGSLGIERAEGRV